MDYIFLWCANIITIHSYLQDGSMSFFENNIKLINSTIKDNVYAYTVSINDRYFDFKYFFYSNTLIHGTLTITDTAINDSRVYAVNRYNSVLRIYQTEGYYDEFHLYNKNVIINFYIENNRKQYVSSFNIDEIDGTTYNVIGNRTETSCITQPPDQLLVTLFAVAGAYDYDHIICPDTIVFSSSKMLMAVYTDTYSQLLCTNMYPKIKGVGNIHVINSDFKQRYEYSKEGLLYHVKEFVKNHSGDEIIKREYGVVPHEDALYVEKYNRTYTVSIDKNTISFVRQ